MTIGHRHLSSQDDAIFMTSHIHELSTRS